MKKIIALVLSACMIFALVACANGQVDQAAVEAAVAQVAEAIQQPAAEASEEEAPNAEDFISDAFIDPLTEWGQYDALIAAIKAETDTAKRTEMMHQAEDILMATWCVIPYYYYNDVYMQKDYVSGIYSNPFATKFFMYTQMANGADTIRINLSSEPDYLDPALNSSVDGACLAANSFSGLYTYDASGAPVPACAESYVVSEDGLTYTVTLKSGLKWSDGSDLTAADFEYSWKRAADLATAADYQYMFSGFEGYSDAESSPINCKAIDDTTFEFVLTAPCAYMEDLMAFPTFFPIKQSEVEKYDDWTSNPGHWAQEAGFISNGAFVLTAWNHDESMTYEKNPYWFDADKVSLNKIEYMLSADDTAIFAAYNAGNLDFADSVPTDEIATLKETANPEFHIVDELGTYYCAFNCKSSLFDGMTPAQAACARKAFVILIDRDYICENIGQTGQKVATSFIPIGMADGNGGIFKTTVEDSAYYDGYAINNDPDATIEEARTLLKAAGFKFGDDGMLSSETPIDLTYLTNPTSGHIAVAESLQQDLAAVGIKLSIEQQDWNVFLEERKQGNFDFAREGWIADFNDPINMLEMWTTNSGNNDCQFGR